MKGLNRPISNLIYNRVTRGKRVSGKAETCQIKAGI